MDKGSDEFEPRKLLSGTLNILGLQIDLGELLASPEGLQGQLAELRERLKQAGGREALSDEEWREGRATVTGLIRTRGILGDQEYHIGAASRPRPTRRPAPEPPETQEPPVDVFNEPEQVTVVAEVPGVGLDDLELKIEVNSLSLATKPTARRQYLKVVPLENPVEPQTLQATCRNGVLEVRLRKRGTGKGGEG